MNQNDYDPNESKQSSVAHNENGKDKASKNKAKKQKNDNNDEFWVSLIPMQPYKVNNGQLSKLEYTPWNDAAIKHQIVFYHDSPGNDLSWLNRPGFTHYVAHDFDGAKPTRHTQMDNQFNYTLKSAELQSGVGHSQVW